MTKWIISLKNKMNGKTLTGHSPYRALLFRQQPQRSVAVYFGKTQEEYKSAEYNHRILQQIDISESKPVLIRNKHRLPDYYLCQLISLLPQRVPWEEKNGRKSSQRVRNYALATRGRSIGDLQVKGATELKVIPFPVLSPIRLQNHTALLHRELLGPGDAPTTGVCKLFSVPKVEVRMLCLRLSFISPPRGRELM